MNDRGGAGGGGPRGGAGRRPRGNRGGGRGGNNDGFGADQNLEPATNSRNWRNGSDNPNPHRGGGRNRRRPFDNRQGGDRYGQAGRNNVDNTSRNEHEGQGSSEDEGNSTVVPRKFFKKPEFERKGPVFGFKRLYSFLSYKSDDVIASINKDQKDWSKLLESQDAEELSGEKLILAIQVLSDKVCIDGTVLLQPQMNVLSACCNKSFAGKLMEAVPKICHGIYVPRRQWNNNSDMAIDSSPLKVMQNMHQFCSFVLKSMPSTAIDIFGSLIFISLGAMCANSELSGISIKFKKLSEEINDISEKEQKKQEKADKWRKRGFDEEDLLEFDGETPPNCIKEIDIIPSIEELRSHSETFLRPNKKKGAYNNAEHYLDVQFRLLREDFVRPLRHGIATFTKNKHEYITRKRKMPIGDVRLYTGVRISQVTKDRDTVVYKLQLDEVNYKKIKWEKSKRLLTGSLIVLTTVENTFKNAYFGVVFNRHVQELEKGVVTVAWEGSSPVYDEDEEYLMFESEVYLEAYRHTLETLKQLDLENFKMKKFIVDSDRVVEAPAYIKNAENLLVVKLHSGEERYMSPLVPNQWPTAEDFGLDDQQYNAFRAALSNEFSIIQGPPGTGKTFLGLKIAEVLLKNANLWKGVDGNPITVVCYTNHALDQFLEGILEFYRKEETAAEIIRIGGRCQSEVLAKYTLREVRNRNRRKLPPHYWNSERNARAEVNELEEERASGMSDVTGLQDLQGIVNFEKLSIWGQIQPEYPKVLWDRLQNLQWLGVSDNQLNVRNYSEIKNIQEWFQIRSCPKKPQRVKIRTVAVQPNTAGSSSAPADDDMDDDEDYDLDELLENRILDDILLEAETSQKTNMGKYLTYLSDCSGRMCEKAIKSINNEIKEVTKGLNSAQTSQFRESKKGRLCALENRKKLLNELFRLYKEQLIDLPNVDDLIAAIRGHVGAVHYDRLKMNERWALYFALVDRARTLIAEKVSEVEKQLSKAQKALRNIIQWGDGLILQDCKVVGLTTTGAAKYNNLLRMMNSKIVIVEEAAEVFEAHIVTCITANCEQLILIGDHRQLRPSPTVYDLAMKFHLDLSLFERMINNNLHCYQLKMQHRMRPNIANLVVGSIYEELLNHDSVKSYPDVKGVKKNLYFLTHMEKEKAETDSCSKSNVHEAKFISALCRYLKLQGYDSSQITVLTMYTGQMFLLKKEITNNKTCKGVRITCVDNFQGEENDVILLSLVRSNDDGKIGFLGIDNRICVSLSRARHGLYVMGNMSAMEGKSKTWRIIMEKLKEEDNVGESLELECQIHGTVTSVRNEKDFNQVREGGCHLLCDSILPCTHKCPRLCHVLDRDHVATPCRQECLKKCGNQLHECKGKCSEKCPPCQVRIEKTLNCDLAHKIMMPCFRKVDMVTCIEVVEKLLPCGHRETLACHVSVMDYKCRIKVPKKLPCGHDRTLECNVDPTSVRCKILVEKSLEPYCEHVDNIECWKSPEDVICSALVKRKLKCGHEAEVKCCDRVKPISCRSNCTTRLNCGHQCVKICHVDDDPKHLLYECKKECSRACRDGHHNCKVHHQCHVQPCPPCKEKIGRDLPCGHQKELECNIDIKDYDCLETCERILPDPYCRHKCPNRCFQSCGPCTVKVKKRARCGHPQEVLCSEAATKENCHELVLPKRTPICGHADGSVPCMYDEDTPEKLVKHCRKPCNHEFNPAMGGCGHSCNGDCSSCFQGRIHMKCNEKCGRQLVCGHVCDVPCSTVCPPCLKPCMMKCEHSECTKKCGEPCSDCKEKCTWFCPHANCSKLCGEMCDREPCDNPCLKKLSCGHQCIGFCGEPCPPLCRMCDKEELTSFYLLGNEDDEDSRFVYLEDCRHTIEVEGLEGWLKTEGSGQIAAKRCPRCKTTIRNCRRFGNLIRQHYKDVMKVKQMSFGNRANSNRMRDEWIRKTNSEPYMERMFPLIHARIRVVLVDEVRASNGQVKTVPKTIDEFTMRGMDFIARCTEKVSQDMLTMKASGKLRSPQFETVTALYRKTLSWMVVRQPLSKQEILDFDEELDRIDFFKQLMMRRCLPNCTPSHPHAYPTYSAAKRIITSTLSFTEERKAEFKILLRALDDQLKTGLGISDRDRQQILQAMGMKQGHWFKCPNGHIYAIDDCGGAMVESRCNECGARIGGGDHRLRSDNQLAEEMDGATIPAWPTALQR